MMWGRGACMDCDTSGLEIIMLTVTDNAGKHMANLLENANAPDEASLRFVVDGDSLGLTIDQPQDGDQTFEHDGRTVLLLDEKVGQLLDERTLDVQDTDDGARLSLE